MKLNNYYLSMLETLIDHYTRMRDFALDSNDRQRARYKLSQLHAVNPDNADSTMIGLINEEWNKFKG